MYRSLTESVLTFNIVSWYNNLLVKHQNKLTQIVNQGSKITGEKQLHLHTVYDRSITKKANQVYDDPTHPLRSSFEFMPSGRLRVPWANKRGYKKSFVPSAVDILNKDILLNKDTL